jgi:TonB family protein
MKEKAGKRLAEINAAYQYLLRNPATENPKPNSRWQSGSTQSTSAKPSQSHRNPISTPAASRSLAFGRVIFAGAVILLIIAVAIGVSHITSSDSGSSTDHDFSVTEGNTIYHGAMSSNVGVAVISVASQPYLFGFGNVVRPDGKFVMVSLAIANQQHDAITMTTSLFELVDPAGNLYSASEKSLEVGTNNDLFLAQINPGVIKTGEVVFDVPLNLSVSDLRLKFRGGMTGDSAEVALKAETTELSPPPGSQESQQPNPSPLLQADPNPSDGVQDQQSAVQNGVSGEEPASPGVGVTTGSPSSSGAPSVSSPSGVASVDDTVHHPGGSVSYPKLIHSVTPEYTEVARQAKLSGTVRLYLWVDKSGVPSHVKVIKGVGMGLDENAIAAVEQYRFEPATEDGQPVTVDLYTDVTFQVF